MQSYPQGFAARGRPIQHHHTPFSPCRARLPGEGRKPTRSFLIASHKGGKMSFNSSQLSVLAYANHFTLWHYNADDAPIVDIGQPGFFDKAADMLNVRDQIIVCAKDQVRTITVTKNDRETVEVHLHGVFGEPL